MDFDQAGRDILVAAIEVFYADDVNGKVSSGRCSYASNATSVNRDHEECSLQILPEIKTALQHEIGFIHIKAVLDRISPGQN